MPRIVKCENCGKKFEPPSTWTEEDARKEQAENGWGNVSNEDMAVVCDECYKIMMAVFNG